MDVSAALVRTNVLQIMQRFDEFVKWRWSAVKRRKIQLQKFQIEGKDIN